MAKVSSELAYDRRAWSASIRGVVNSIGDAGEYKGQGLLGSGAFDSALQR